MNKKFSTLLAGLMLATGVNGWAAVYNAGAVMAPYTVQGADLDAPFSLFTVDNATWNATFPRVSPFELSIANGAKPISALQAVDGTRDSRYFQIVVGDADATGKELLTMVWVTTDAAGLPVAGHYELQIENVNNANAVDIKLDRTLWEVRVTKDPVSTTLYYTLINKATQMTLQLPTTGTSFTLANGKTYQEAPVNVIAGATSWLWANGQVASEASTIAGAGSLVLKDGIRGQFSNGQTIYLVKKTVGTAVSLSALIANSNDPLIRNYVGEDVVNGTTTYTPIIFEAWEANPIVLTADQINAELGNETILTSDQRTPGFFNFFFAPDVQGATNTMVAKDFVAVAPIAGANRLPGDAPDGFVRFQLRGDATQFLRVDTAYHDPSVNGTYDLQVAVGKILYPREAVSADGRFVDSNGWLTMTQGGAHLTDTQIYGAASAAPVTAQSFTQLKRMSNFRPIFYPSTQGLRLQAEMLFKADKAKLAAGQSWWRQMADDAAITTATALSPIGSMLIAPAAANPGLVSSVPGAAEGYYPAYTQTVNVNPTLSVQAGRVVHYVAPWVAGVNANGYNELGNIEALTGGLSTPRWNAVGNLFVADNSIVPAAGDMLALDPASTVTTVAGVRTYSNLFALAHSNLIRLVSLTPGHVVLTAMAHDRTDVTFNGQLTNITILKLKTYDDVASITPGFYYIANANKINTTLQKNGEYRYEDLAATNATFTFWNAMTQRWDVGAASNATAVDPTILGGGDANRSMDFNWHTGDRANTGSIVYSGDKKEIPSAQWYVSGNGGNYTITNRESGRVWNTSYWWKTSEPNVYVNMATFTNSAGLQQSYRDTIRLEAVAPGTLQDISAGYLNISQEVAKADTSVYNFKFASLGDVELYLGQASATDSILKVMKETPGKFKLERVRINDKDIYSQAAQATDNLLYGFNTTDPTTQLARAQYYIYKDEVSGNSGAEGTGIRTREYITLESGKYRLAKVTVNLGADGYTTSTNAAVIAGSQADVRRAFYVKQASTVAPGQYVLVDPEVVSHDTNATGTDYFGARAYANQVTAEIQPAGLISTATSNAFDNSIFTLEKVQAYNYRDIRAAGVDRDTVEFYVASHPDYLISENNKIAGSNVGLAESASILYGNNNALFVDTANVSESEFPRFLLGVRNVDSLEISNIPGHNHHIQTTADYLVNLVDSAAINPVYKYRNIDQNTQTTCYRLGFLKGVHKGTNLTINKGGKVFDLSKKGDAGMNYATFAFRYADVNRDNFFIETVYNGTQKGWLQTINHVLVVTPNIQQAEVFQVKKSTSVPTDNEGIETTVVSVIAGNGQVVINNAQGKTVAISNILGQTLVNTVLTSDNVTISVPAGIVVVAVEGEAAVKAIVK